MALTNTQKLALGYRYRGELQLSPWMTQLQFEGGPSPKNPVYLGNGYVAVAPEMPVRRRVSIEEFEADMRSVHKVRG